VTLLLSGEMFDPEDAGRPLDLLDILEVTETEIGEGARHTEVVTRTGLLGLIWHGRPDETGRVVVTCGGTFGGFHGPAQGLYRDLGVVLAEVGVCTVRVDYRLPGHLAPCTLDLGAAIDLAHRGGGERFVTVGHSFGGAVAIGAAVHMPALVVGVVALATQSAGVVPPVSRAPDDGHVRPLSDRPFLLVHGERDEVIPPAVSETVREFAGHGEVVRLPGASHRLNEAADELRHRLPPWLVMALDGVQRRF
jgi:pimeloyl-ACP methyl ester carboxylesterase